MLAYFVARFDRFTHLVAVAGMVVMFAAFIFGVGMRQLGHPQSWVDETVTILAAWTVFWASTFVLKWSEFISFDMIFRSLPAQGQRAMMAIAAAFFLAVMGYCIPEVAGYVHFMKIMTTDMLQIPLDRVYSIFLVFLIGMCLRLAFLFYRLVFCDWRAALAELSAVDVETEVL